MSLILDALRKSERTRQQTLTGRVSAADAPPARARIPVPWTTLIGLLLIANAVVLGIIFWRSHVARTAPLPVEAPRTIAAPTTPALVLTYRPEVRPLAAEAAAAGASPVLAQTVSTPMAPSSGASATKQPPSATTAVTGATPVAAPGNAPSAGVIALNQNDAPPLDTLPLTFQQSLPPLHLDVHSYSANPADRFVVINMQRYRAGDTLKEGPKVIAIVPQGVILEYQGQPFLLPRP